MILIKQELLGTINEVRLTQNKISQMLDLLIRLGCLIDERYSSSFEVKGLSGMDNRPLQVV